MIIKSESIKKKKKAIWVVPRKGLEGKCFQWGHKFWRTGGPQVLSLICRDFLTLPVWLWDRK
ncbi:unnamed protein product [Staurois parvus]|uniref:Uncharacterized protein n=1 Tax=Staurois parvus TaxID=386267 RepID=A0ABN9E1K1_9NEOB|nr:unnamed protein product [Staurois parvus]